MTDDVTPLLDLRAAFEAGDRAAIARAAADEGCVLITALVDRERALAAGRRLARACDEHSLRAGPDTVALAWDDPRLVAVQAAVLPSAEVRALAADPRLAAALAMILGDGVSRRGGDVLRVVFPGAPPTPPHQDAHYLTAPPPVWIAWLPLVDCPLQGGPLAVIAGSHAAGLRNHDGPTLASRRARVDEGERWSASPLRAGDALLLSALTVHRALPNRSPAPRLSVDLRFGPA